MTEDRITATVRRFDPSVDSDPYFESYEVPVEPGMTVLGVLDYIYQNLDGTLAYYDHAGCALGICARCTCRINGSAALICQTPVTGDLLLEPVAGAGVVRDLVVERGREETAG